MAEARLRQDILFPAGASLGISVDEALKVRRVNDPDSRAIKAARKGLREAELTDAQKARHDAKAARAKERRRAQAKARKKAKPLSDAQIAARKEKFQRKKKRRAERAAAASTATGRRTLAGLLPRAGVR